MLKHRGKIHYPSTPLVACNVDNAGATSHLNVTLRTRASDKYKCNERP